MRATTDNENIIRFDEEKKPGISNLLNIAALISGKRVNELETEFKYRDYKEFKEYVALITAKHIGEMRKRYDELINSKELDIILDKGRDKSRKLVSAKLKLLQEKMGLIR